MAVGQCIVAHVAGNVPCRLFRNTEELEKLSELGVLFLLFEMGLELSLDRLKVCCCICLICQSRTLIALHADYSGTQQLGVH